MSTSTEKILKRAAAALLILAVLYVIVLIYASGQLLLATVCLGVFALSVYIFWSSRMYSYRYLYPGLAGIAIFIVLPLVYTARIGFTNRSTTHLQSFERVTNEHLLRRRYRIEGDAYRLSLHRDDQAFRLVFDVERQGQKGQKKETGGLNDLTDLDDLDPAAEGGADNTAGKGASSGARPPPEVAGPRQFVTAAIALDENTPDALKVKPVAESGFQPGKPLPYYEVAARKDILNRLVIEFPNGTTAVADKNRLERFVPEKLRYSENPDGTLTDHETGQLVTPDFETGYYRTADGQAIEPGFTIDIGFDHYVRIFSSKSMREPFVQIFTWTVVFAGLTVLFTLIVGFTLSELMSWEALRFRGFYRLMLFLPYAVPGFISILVFKGLFNENSGEINLILEALLGIEPHWFSDPFLAKVCILIVNTWLGYPYIMLLCMGLKKSIPTELYEASAVDGAGPLDNIMRITWPLIRKPLMPLLISSFAFNFNNFVLIILLTGGRPDIIGTTVAAGETDILVSYTYRIAFEDAGQQYGLAAAVATNIFFIVAILSIINLKLTRVETNSKD